MQSQYALLNEAESPNKAAPDQRTTTGILITRIRRIARQRFDNAPGSHDWQHTLRVHRLCQRIGPLENADMVTLEAAAYLHDLGRSIPNQEEKTLCHAIKGAQIAKEILAPLPLSIERKENITHCVRSHRFRGDQPPDSTEAKVLFDADKLDAIGAVGIARAYLFAGELGACLHNPDIPPEEAVSYSRNDTGHREYAVKLSKIKDRMLTTHGRQLAQERHSFMETFFERFFNEYEGKY